MSDHVDIHAANAQLINKISEFVVEFADSQVNKDETSLTAKKFNQFWKDAKPINSQYKQAFYPYVMNMQNVPIGKKTIEGLISVCGRTVFLFINNRLLANHTINTLNNMHDNVVRVVQAVNIFQTLKFEVHFRVEVDECIKLLISAVRRYSVENYEIGMFYTYQNIIKQVARLPGGFIALIKEIDASVKFFALNLLDFNETELTAQNAEVLLAFVHMAKYAAKNKRYPTSRELECVSPLMTRLEKIERRAQFPSVQYAIKECVNFLGSFQDL